MYIYIYTHIHTYVYIHIYIYIHTCRVPLCVTSSDTLNIKYRYGEFLGTLSFYIRSSDKRIIFSD